MDNQHPDQDFFVAVSRAINTLPGDHEKLGHAAMTNNILTLKSLIDKGADLNEPYQGYRPLVWCIEKNNLNGATILVDAGANTCDVHYQSSPLCYAIRKANLPIIKLLIANGAGFLLHEGLITAIEEQKVEIVRELINLGANVNHPNGQSEFPVFCAISRRNLDILELLVKQGCDLNKVDSKGRTPLMVAVRKMNVPCIKYLLEKKVDLNKKTTKNKTALSLSLIKNDFRTFQLLIEAGADPTLAAEEIEAKIKTNPHLAAFMSKVQRENVTKAPMTSFAGHEAAQ